VRTFRLGLDVRLFCVSLDGTIFWFEIRMSFHPFSILILLLLLVALAFGGTYRAWLVFPMVAAHHFRVSVFIPFVLPALSFLFLVFSPSVVFADR